MKGYLRAQIGVLLMLAVAMLATGLPRQALAMDPGLRLAMAEAAQRGDGISEIYRERGYQPIWTGRTDEDLVRRMALLRNLDNASLHGLPTSRYDLRSLRTMIEAMRSQRDLAVLDVAMTRAFLRYAKDMHSGVVVPSRVDNGIKRKRNTIDNRTLINGLMSSKPDEFFADLAPRSAAYRALMKHRLLLERTRAEGGWGATVAYDAIKPGESGKPVISLRNRLIAMGYLERTLTTTYDGRIENAVSCVSSVAWS